LFVNPFAKVRLDPPPFPSVRTREAPLVVSATLMADTPRAITIPWLLNEPVPATVPEIRSRTPLAPIVEAPLMVAVRLEALRVCAPLAAPSAIDVTVGLVSSVTVYVPA